MVPLVHYGDSFASCWCNSVLYVFGGASMTNPPDPPTYRVPSVEDEKLPRSLRWRIWLTYLIGIPAIFLLISNMDKDTIEYLVPTNDAELFGMFYMFWMGIISIPTCILAFIVHIDRPIHPIVVRLFRVWFMMLILFSLLIIYIGWLILGELVTA